MNHILLPMMAEPVFPEDTSFAVFEEDWCLTERHALIREIRANNLWRPFLDVDEQALADLQTKFEQADQTIVFDRVISPPRLQTNLWHGRS